MSSIARFHTVTTEELLNTDYKEKAIYKVSGDMTITTLISTGDWEPRAIYSSHINGDLLVGMSRNTKWWLTRFSKDREKLEDIQEDDKGQNLYQSIHYITENINGDICVSDYQANKMVAVTRSGQFRFSYSGHQSQPGFCPLGICTNALGHILVCDAATSLIPNWLSLIFEFKIRVLKEDGQFLTFLNTSNLNPCSLCVDDDQNLWVGYKDNPTIKVYKYGQKIYK